MSHPDNVEYRNGPLGAAVRYPNSTSFDPVICWCLTELSIRMSPSCACLHFSLGLAAADRDFGAEMFAHPSTLAKGVLLRSPPERQSERSADGALSASKAVGGPPWVEC